MKYYLKMAFMPFIYLLFSAMLGLSIGLLNEDLMILEYFLCALNLALYAVVIGVAAFKDGQSELKIRMENDIYRQRIIETGEDYPLRRLEEYKPWKGYVIGLISAIPSVVLILIHFIMMVSSPKVDNTFGVFAGLLNMVVFSFFMVKTPIPSWQYVFSLLYIPFILVVYGLLYHLGGRQMQKQYDKIEAIKKQIGGGNK